MMEKQREDVKEVVLYNYKFHLTINQLSGNIVTQLLFNSFKPVYSYYIEFFFALPGAADRVISEYEKLTWAIKKQDDTYAAHLMDEILTYGNIRVKEGLDLLADGRQVKIR